MSAAGKQDPKALSRVYLRWTPHPVIVTVRDNGDYIRVLLYSYYTTITGWGVLLRYTGIAGVPDCFNSLVLLALLTLHVGSQPRWNMDIAGASEEGLPLLPCNITHQNVIAVYSMRPRGIANVMKLAYISLAGDF